jgi:hypothetical protein
MAFQVIWSPVAAETFDVIVNYTKQTGLRRKFNDLSQLLTGGFWCFLSILSFSLL